MGGPSTTHPGGETDPELERAKRQAALFDADLKGLDLLAKRNRVLRYLPLVQALLSAAGVTVAIAAYILVQRPLAAFQIQVETAKREADVPRISPQLSYKCLQVLGPAVDAQIRFDCSAILSYKNVGAGPFEVRGVTFRLYRGSPCYYLPTMDPSREGTTPAVRLLTARSLVSLPQTATASGCARGSALPLGEIGREGTPNDRATDVYWELIDTVVSNRSGYNGVSLLERDESVSASARWYVALPSWQYAYISVETEIEWSVQRSNGDKVESKPRGLTDRRHSNWYSYASEDIWSHAPLSRQESGVLRP